MREDYVPVAACDDDIQSLIDPQESPQITVLAQQRLRDCLLNEKGFQLAVHALAETYKRQHGLHQDLSVLLKRFYLDLRSSARTSVERAVVDLLRSRRLRLRLAQDTSEILRADVSEEAGIIDPLLKEVSLQRLEGWIQELYPGDELEDVPENGPEANDDEYGLGRPQIDPGVAEALSRVEFLQNFVFRSTAYQQFLQRIRAHVIRLEHAWVIRALGTISADNIDFVTKYEPTHSERYQILLEEYTGSSWDWWPLRRPRPRLGPGMCRITWTCVSSWIGGLFSAERLM